MIAVANIWLFFYTPDIGLIDQISRCLDFLAITGLVTPPPCLAASLLLPFGKKLDFS